MRLLALESLSLKITLRAIINALNKSLYNIAKSYGINSPRFYYTLSGEEVAVNRYIMAPDEVKFSGVLKQ